LTIPVAAKQRRKIQAIDDGRYVDKLAFAIQSCGDYDKVLQGLWEHYPNLLPNDKSLGNVDRLHDWVMFYDRLAGRVGESQEWELMGFMSYGIVPWYTHMASPANNTKHVEWPKSDYEVSH
jgi:chromosome transmission fidelity protein 18